jgi:hypothetical protein
MLQFRNRTGFAGTFFTSPDPDGVDSVYAVVKATYTLAAAPVLVEEQQPISLQAEHYGDPAASSMRVPADLALIKPGTDVVVIGHAWTPEGRPMYYLDVSVSVGPIAKTVRVFGDRHWEQTGIGLTVSHPQTFTHMPLVWERAYGGTRDTPQGSIGDLRNPLGIGFRAPGEGAPEEGTPVANIEDPARPITTWRDTPMPAGLGPVPAHWEPRRHLAGTYDARWQTERAPYLPADFDARFFHFAPAGLATPAPLAGGEWVQLDGLSPAGRIAFPLPRHTVQIAYDVDGVLEHRTASLDAVVFLPDECCFTMVWRSVLACDRKLLKVKEIVAELADGAAEGVARV